jgi:hypothetical protein
MRLDAAGVLMQCNHWRCWQPTRQVDEDHYHITHLVIPPQSGTADTCTTHNEDQVFHYLQTHDLISIGWIHVCGVYCLCEPLLWVLIQVVRHLFLDPPNAGLLHELCRFTRTILVSSTFA